MTDRLLPLRAMRWLTLAPLIWCAWLLPACAPAAEAGPRDPLIVVSVNNPLCTLRPGQVPAIFMA